MQSSIHQSSNSARSPSQASAPVQHALAGFEACAPQAPVPSLDKRAAGISQGSNGSPQFDLLTVCSDRRAEIRVRGRRTEAQQRALREAYRMRGVRQPAEKVRHGHRICAELLAMLREGG